MAFGTATWWEVNSGGSDTANSGGFDPGATMATDLAATVATSTAPVVTSASYTFVAGDADHYLFIKAGTNWIPGLYQIASVSAGAATLAATIGSAILYQGNTQKNVVAGCATTASPTGGTWSVDYSRKTTPFIALTDMVIDGTTNTKFTSALNPNLTNLPGNTIVVTGGTGFTTQRVEILSVASSVTATCDKSLGTLSSTGGTGGLGGAMASPGAVGALSQAGNLTFVKGGATYSMSSTANVAGGRWNQAGSVCGYSTTRAMYNLDSNLPVLQSSSNSMSIIRSNGSCFVSSIVIANGNSNTSVTGLDDTSANLMTAFNVQVTGVATAISIYQNTWIQYCTAINCTGNTPIFCNGGGNKILDSVITGGGGFGGGNIVSSILRCIVSGNSKGVPDFDSFGLVDHCVSYNHTGGSDAIQNPDIVVNSLVVSLNHAANVGIKQNQAGAQNYNWYVLNTGFYNNTGDLTVGASGMQVVSKIPLTADPFTNAAGGDFSLNSTAGGGTLLKALGFPTSFLGISTTQAIDVGAAQSAAGASGYPTRARVFTGM